MTDRALVAAGRAVGRPLVGWLRAAGALALLAGRSATALGSLDGRELARILAWDGAQSLGLVAITAALAGALVVVQTGFFIRQLGVLGLLGWGAGYASLREVCPLLVALVYAGRVGAARAAEVAALRAGEQLPALEALGVDSVRALLAPRLWGMAASVLLLTAFGDVVALAAAALAARGWLGLPVLEFWRSMRRSLGPRDAALGLEKSAAFGLAIALSALRAGLAAPANGRGVGQAARAAVVHAIGWILLLDVLLTGGM